MYLAALPIYVYYFSLVRADGSCVIADFGLAVTHTQVCRSSLGKILTRESHESVFSINYKCVYISYLKRKNCPFWAHYY